MHQALLTVASFYGRAHEKHFFSWGGEHFVSWLCITCVCCHLTKYICINVLNMNIFCSYATHIYVFAQSVSAFFCVCVCVCVCASSCVCLCVWCVCVCVCVITLMFTCIKTDGRNNPYIPEEILAYIPYIMTLSNNDDVI